MAEISSLEISIESSAKKANDAINSLIANLGKLNKALSIDTSKLSNLGKSIDLSGISKQTKAISESMGNVGAKLSQSMKPIQEQAQKSAKDLSQITEQYKDSGKGFTFSGDAALLKKQIDSYSNALEKAKLKKQEFEASGKTEGQMYDYAVRDVLKYGNVLESLKTQLSSVEVPYIDLSVLNQEELDSWFKNLPTVAQQAAQSITSSLGQIEIPKIEGIDVESLTYNASAMKAILGEAAEEIQNYGEAIAQFGQQAGAVLNQPIKTDLSQMSTKELDEWFNNLPSIKAETEKAAQSINNTLNQIEQPRSINISTESLNYNADAMKAILGEAAEGVKNFQDAVQNSGNQTGKILNESTSRMQDFGERLKNLEIPPIREENLKKLQSSLEKTETKLDELRANLANGLEMGRITESVDDKNYVKLQEQIALTEKQAEALRAKIQEVQLQSKTNWAESLSNALGKVSTFAKQAHTSLSRMSAVLNRINGGIGKVFGKFASLGKSLTNLSKSSKKSEFSLSKAFKMVLRYGLGIRSVYVLINKMRRAIIDGFKNLAQYSDEVNASISMLKGSFETLKNSSAAALSPLLNAIAPALNMIIQLCIRATNAINQFLSALFGKGTWIKAKDQVVDYADSLDKASGASDKLKTHVLGIDELNIYEPDDSGKGSGGTSAVNPEDMFETVPIESRFLELAEKVKKIFEDLFKPLKIAWDNDGKNVMDAWKYALDEVWKLIKDIGRDFLRVWNQKETIDMFEDILQIIGDIGLSVGNLARNLRVAWNYNDTGFHILENIRDIFAVIIHNIREAADATVIWSDRLDFKPIMIAIESFTRSLIPVADTLSGILTDFYILTLLPLSKWTLEKGLPDLLDVMTELNNSINWDKIRNSFKELDKELFKISKFTFKALYDFIKNFLSPISKFTMNEAVPLLVDTITDLSQKIEWDLLNSALATLWEALSKFVVGIGSGIITFFEEVEPFLTSVVAEFINQIALAIEFLGSVFNMIPDSIIEGFGSALAGILSAFVIYQGTGEIVRSIGMGIETMCTAVSNGFALLTAHPYMAIAAGIAAVAGALLSMNKSAEEQEQIEIFGDKLSNITDNINNAAEAIKNRTQASKEYVENAGLAEAQMAKDLADRYFELSEKEKLTNEEKLEMQTLASKLVDTLPSLESYYDTETGLLDITRESLDDLIDSKLREIQLNAVEGELTKAYQDRIQAMNDLETASELVGDAQNRMTELEQKYKDASDKTELLTQYEELSIKLQNAEGDTEELLEDQQKLWEALTNGGKEEFPTFDSLHQKMAEASQEIYDFKNEYDQVMKSFGVSQEAYQGVEKNIAELTGMFTSGMTDAARDGIDGFSEEMKGDTETGNAMVENAQNAFEKWKGTEGWDSHSPSKKTYQTAVDVIDGFNKGISENTQSSIDAVTEWATAVSNAMKSALGIGGMEDTADPSTSMFGGMVSNFTSAWSLFSETWTEYLEAWKVSNEELYFGEEIWNTNWMNIYNTYLKVWAQFEKQWKTNFDKWWKIQIVPYFSVKQWTEFGTNMKNGLYGGFRSIVNDVAGILNSMISMFDSAFTKLEKAMNKLIDDYNKAAKEMGTSTISKVSYEKMGKISVPAYAAGGFPEDGLFFANSTELVGEFANGRTAVANNEMIIEGFKRGVKEAVSEVLAPYLAEISQNTRETADKDMTVNIGDDEIFEANRRASDRFGWQF